MKITNTQGRMVSPYEAPTASARAQDGNRLGANDSVRQLPTDSVELSAEALEIGRAKAAGKAEATSQAGDLDPMDIGRAILRKELEILFGDIYL